MSRNQERLIVGADESINNGEGGKRWYEVDAVVFSYLSSDRRIATFSGRDYGYAKKWLVAEKERGCLVGLNFNPRLMRARSCLPHIIIRAVREILKQNGPVDNIEIHVDGPLHPEKSDFLRGSFPEYPKIVIKHYEKNRKPYSQPRVVQMADEFSSGILRSMKQRAMPDIMDELGERLIYVVGYDCSWK